MQMFDFFVRLAVFIRFYILRPFIILYHRIQGKYVPDTEAMRARHNYCMRAFMENVQPVTPVEQWFELSVKEDFERNCPGENWEENRQEILGEIAYEQLFYPWIKED